MYLHQAHATGRRYRRKKMLGSFFKYANGTQVCMENVLADDWQVEPEIYEVECEWRRVDTESGGWCCVPFQDGGNSFGNLWGKRTKLTIEVIKVNLTDGS